MKFDNLKEIFITVFTIGGAALAKLMGGMDKILIALLWFIVIDYITGCILSLVFKKSTKSQNGAYASNAGFKGIVKKVIILICVFACTQLDIALGFNGVIRSLVIMFFIANEFLSIIENTGLMGVPWPKAIKNMLEVLRDKMDNAKIESKGDVK